MRCDCGDRPLQRRWGRRVAIAVLAVVAGLGVVCADAATRSGDIAAPHPGSTVSVLNITSAAVPDTTIARAAHHVTQFVTAHRPAVAVTAVSLLLPLLLLGRRRPPIPVAVSPGRYRRVTPLRRAPPTLLAR